MNQLFENLKTEDRSSENRALVSKWAKSGLLEGLRAEEKGTLSVLLENQAKQLIKEGSATTAGQGGAGYEQWTGVALPLIRRIFAEIAAKEFVSVQPMNLPSGLVFYLDFKYGTNKGVQGFDPTGQNQTGTLQGITSASGTPTDGLYGAGRFGYSINQAVSASATSITTASATQADVFFDGLYSASVGTHTSPWRKVTIAAPSNADLSAVRSFRFFSGSTEITGSNILPAFTKVNGSNIDFIISASVLTAPTYTSYAVSYSVLTTNNSRGDFEASPVSSTNRTETTLAIPEIELQMRSTPVTAKTRKLKASWTPEFAQDLNAYHSIDAEAELTAMLSEYVSMEIDLEILDMLIQAAQTVDYWSARVGQEYNAATGTFAQGQYTGTAYIQGTWFQTLGTKVQKISNEIHRKTLRGGANFLVCSPTVATILESIPGYAADTDGLKMKFAMGVQKIGAITSRYQVYKNPYMTENTILMGFRGSQFLETGAVYAPYIPLMLTPLVYDPTNFTPRRGVMTRYAKLVTRPEFYGRIQVADLNVL